MKLKSRHPEGDRARQKDALMPGSDVEGKRSEGCRIKNGGEYRAEPQG